MLGSRRARTSWDRYGKKIGRKILTRITIGGIIGLKKIKMVIIINGVSGRRARKAILSLVKSGVKFIIVNMIIGKESLKNILIILKIRKISLI